LVTPPAALVRSALKLDAPVMKLTSPVPWAFKPRTPVMFWLCVVPMPSTCTQPVPVVLRFSPPELLMRANSSPEMVICPAASAPPSAMLRPLLAMRVMSPLPDDRVLLLPCRSRSAA
jgi:hypothetical protein